MSEARHVTKSRWPVLSPLLDELLDLELPQRAARLAEIRADDAGLADDLQELLVRQEVMEQADFLSSPTRPAISAGQAVGAYTLEREIGQGGMGTVWLARRTDGRYEGQVAIKFLTAGLLGQGQNEQFSGRFAREGQILARLAHPNIARLVDAGVASGGGQPYLVLEYVDGLPITRFCEHHALDVTARVRLFLDVLAAVAHAHNRLILHRDLKPSNILVTAAAEVKLLDFGIAKLLAKSTGAATEPVDPATELTQRAGRAFTPQYAAPEQVQGGEVTTATDVYALGVLLYLLLSGQHPTATAATEALPLERMKAVIELEPKRLSEQVRGRDPKRAGELRGDLDTIVARALKKAPAERYANASAMADDLRRWLAHEPIAARPDSAAYRLSKFVRRHRIGVAASAAVALALGIGVGVAIWEGREAQRQRDQAEGLIEFMLGDLRKQLEPVGRLDVMDAVGERALAYYAALDTNRQTPDSLGRRSRAMHLMGEIAEKRGKLDEAARMFREAAESTAELLARSPRDGQRVFDHAQSVYWVGFVARRRGQVQEAQQQFQEYLTLARRLAVLAPDHLEWRAEEAYAADNLGVLQFEAGQTREALQTFSRTRDVWAALSAHQPEAQIEQAISWGWIARAHTNLNDYAAAITAERRKLALLDQSPGAQGNRRLQQLRATALHSISRAQLLQGELDPSEHSEREALQHYQALAEQDPANLDWLANLSTARLGLAELLEAQGKQAELRESLGLLARDIGRLLPANPDKIDWQLSLRGRLLQLQIRAGDHRGEAAHAQLRDYLGAISGLAAQGKQFNGSQIQVVAGAELLLGDLLAADPRFAQLADAQWQHAMARLDPQREHGDLQSINLQALALQRLRRTQEAAQLADILKASPYRHPRYGELQRALQAPGSNDSNQSGKP